MSTNSATEKDEAMTGTFLTVDGGQPVAVRSAKITADSTHGSLGGAYITVPMGELISVELDKLPCPTGMTGQHKLRLQHGETVYNYNAILVEYDVTRWGPVRMVWHTIPTISSHSYGDSGRLLSKVLPALALEQVSSPCDHVIWRGDLQSIIVHLNDNHQWTREQIADWLDSLDVDLTFPVPDHIPSNIN